MVDFSLLRQPNYMAVALGAAQAGAALGAQKRRDEALRQFGQTGDVGALERSGDAELLGVAQKQREAQREGEKAAALGRVFAPEAPVATQALGASQLEEGSTFTPPEAGPAPQPMRAPTTADGLAINWGALREYATLDPDGAMKLANAATAMDAARLKRVQAHGEVKARAAFALRNVPAGPQREAMFASMKSQLLAQGFTDADLQSARLDDASLDKDIAFGMTLDQMVDKADRDRAFEAAERTRQASEARAARAEGRAEVRFRERDLDRKAIAGSGGGNFDALLGAFRGE